MLDENDRLKAKVSMLEAAFKTHVRNMDWKYAAPEPPPDLYWIEQGYDYGEEEFTHQDYIDSINEHFFRPTKDQSEKLRRGTFGLQNAIEEVCFGYFEADDYGPLIRYDDALLPHWDEFCESMRQWLSSVRGTIERTHPFFVIIKNIELPANVLKMLRETFKLGGLGHIEGFHLTKNEFQRSEGIEFALEIMQSQMKLTDFFYQNNPVDNGEDRQRLVDAIVSHPNISDCGLGGLCRGDSNGHDYLVSILRKEGMKTVFFADCGVNTGGQSTLFDMIQSHPNLDFLDLDDNKLNDKDAIRLADALRHNRTLDYLSLERNEFTQLGEDVLKKVVYDDSSLNALANSNHVCTIVGLEYAGKDFSYCEGGKKDSRRRSRARKILHLLEERNKEGTNVYHLETEMGEDTLKVVPLVLAAVQICFKQKAKVFIPKWNGHVKSYVMKGGAAALSITYELLRSWHATALHGGNCRVTTA